MSIIEYKDVELLRKEHVVLKHVSFDVQPGEMVYLIGSVGSGKSTLLKSFYGEVPVMAGDARVFDYDLTSLRLKQVPMLRRKIGIVFQDFQLLMERNVFANLDFVPQGGRMRKIARNASTKCWKKWAWPIRAIRCPTN